MTNWDQNDDAMWIPPRPSTSSGDQYNKHKRKDKRSTSSLHINTNNSTSHNQRRRYNDYNHNYNNYGQNTYNDPKRVIIAKKKKYASNDINDSFIATANLDQKQQKQQEQYLMEHRANTATAQLANYKHKQQRYSQIKDEFGLSNHNTQSRKIIIENKANHDNISRFKVLQRNNEGCTKLAILDLIGDMNEDELYAELDRKSKSNTPLKPIRPPIPTPHSVVLSTPTSSVQSLPKSESKGSSCIRPTVILPTDKDKEAIAVLPTVVLPTVQPKPEPIDSEEVEQTERSKTFKGGFVPHDVGRNVRSKYEYNEEEIKVKSITNDVRNIDMKNNSNNDRFNVKNKYNYNGKKNRNSNNRGYQSRRNERNDGYYNEYYDDNGYNDYYERSNNDSYNNYGRNRSYPSDNSYNKSYRSDSRYYHPRNNKKY